MSGTDHHILDSHTLYSANGENVQPGGGGGAPSSSVRIVRNSEKSCFGSFLQSIKLILKQYFVQMNAILPNAYSIYGAFTKDAGSTVHINFVSPVQTYKYSSMQNFDLHANFVPTNQVFITNAIQKKLS